MLLVGRESRWMDLMIAEGICGGETYYVMLRLNEGERAAFQEYGKSYDTGASVIWVHKHRILCVTIGQRFQR